MATLKELTEEMDKFHSKVENILYVSGYEDEQDLSGLSDYKQLRSADERQLLEEYSIILYKLDEINRTLNYLKRPVCEVGTLHLNESGRYETEGGRYYTSGSTIEFLRQVEVFDYEKRDYVFTDVWTCGRVECDNGKYYIIHFKGIEMEGLKVRVR